MTTAEPFEPIKNVGEDRPAAADPGLGAPSPAEGFGEHDERDEDVFIPEDGDDREDA
jgi:hypothetical protein